MPTPTDDYEDRFTQTIEPLYGARRSRDEDVRLCAQANPHELSVERALRRDFTVHSTYSVDPPGCEDADDAFSVFREGGALLLAIHIADPTDIIPPASELWTDIRERVVTRYPSNRAPVHLMPTYIVNRSSLVRITFFVASYASEFLNLIVNRINDHPVHMSYTLRIACKKIRAGVVEAVTTETKHCVEVSTVVCPATRFDVGTLPDLDAYVCT
jgi:hypothetical protein